ncbi:hypothetical protein [Amycolatopsis minnesotensis]|uniref:WXG100 family type VII secretion target n=1 Tax=Amycolatopsis minnesotensis TaxID=337894 RepID=A0ABN2S8V3_9PSEU
MSRFDVNHDGYMDVNESLRQCHVATGVILEELNAKLRNISEGFGGKAATVWAPLQADWTKIYQSMQSDFNDSVTRSFNVHEIFKEGDNMGARIMNS